MPTLLGLTTVLQAAPPPAPSKGGDWGMWYILVVVAGAAFVGFWVLRRVADIAAKRKTDAMIREVGEPKDAEGDFFSDKDA